ncbi:unnamed protein product [Hydatigera taeniaeformis]|uniref:Pre-mRNA-splicing factor CWC25 homolog n=1 Tax=Hydatigena taeniaeformis TaxID=6205 RepID=A0A0R3WIR2_HYDTA|nr:unnamed protein product [Hydatigera taeniaeformis]
MSLQSELEKLPPDERRKIGELIKAKDNNQQQSKNAGGPDTSTSWMYEQPKGNAEDFLLGKAIRSLEELTEINRDQEEETPAQRLTRLDMEAKFREDPLNLMRQHEMDKRSALLQNTARMKKLQHLIELQNHAKEKAEKRKEAKKIRNKGKKKRRRISSSSTDSSENPEDDAILEKFISLIRNPDGKKGKSQNSSKGEEKKNEKKGKHRHAHHSQKMKVNLPSNEKFVPSKHLSPLHHPQNSSFEEPSIRSNDRSRRRSISTSNTKAPRDSAEDRNTRKTRCKSSRSPCFNQSSQKQSCEDSFNHTDSRVRRRSRSRSQRKSYGGLIDDGNRHRPKSKSPFSTRRQVSADSSHCSADRFRCKFRSSLKGNLPRSYQHHRDDRTRYKSRSRSSTNSPHRRRSPPPSNLHRRNKRSSRSRSFERSYREGGHRRTQEEMAALRAQMMADAKEREAERRQRFEKHQMETAKEDKMEGEARVKHGASFLRGLTLDHVASTSVEEVVQRNAKSRQRGGMDENFLRR